MPAEQLGSNDGIAELFEELGIVGAIDSGSHGFLDPRVLDQAIGGQGYLESTYRVLAVKRAYPTRPRNVEP